MEELIAVPGEEMIIPCHYPLETLGKALQVTWYSGDSKECTYISLKIYSSNTTHRYDRFSLVNFPEDVSLHMHNVQNNEHHRYCCLVTTSNGPRISSRHGTELTITGSQSSSTPFTVTQTHKITGLLGESMTLSCSYRGYMESDVLWVNIYWRLGNLTGPYVYHPYKEMVHPSYRGRTGIKGPADLHIRGLQMSDDSTYYCFVMLRLCTGVDEYEKLIQYGAGTQLIVTDQLEKELHPHLLTSIFASSIGIKFFISLVLFLLALFYYKDK
ncbi:uncharacterized protein [Eleutherodactylus coqui]|uniref:uncharacterized protein n=1 Tax=Eleutherodactylus coqui TaxID=57060 RepID=UPI0034623EA5